jgi:hypothetical protein
MVEHRGEALPGLDPLGLYEGEEGGMVEDWGEASLGQVHQVLDQVQVPQQGLIVNKLENVKTHPKLVDP